MDVSKAGKVVAEQMGALERDYGDKEDYEVAGVISVVVVQGPDGAQLRIRSNMSNPAMTLGVMRMAEDEYLRALRRGSIEGAGDDDDSE
jgi:hypothetical protein